MRNKNQVVAELIEIAMNDGAEIAGVQQLSDSEIAHLAQLSRVLDDPADDHALKSWFLDALHDELQRRQSGGAIEAGTVLLRVENWSDVELFNAITRIVCLTSFNTLSKSERTFVTNTLHVLIRGLSVRASQNQDGFRLLTRKDVAELLAIDPDQVIGLVRKGILPMPVRLTPRVHRWHSRDVAKAMDRYIEETRATD
jgi:predicted DNA-binding transcriptional regulator AlpA